MKQVSGGYHFVCPNYGERRLEVSDYLERYANPFDALYVMEKMDAGICVLDPETLNFLYLNQKACRVLGFEPHEILGRSYLELMPSRFHRIRRMHRETLDQCGQYGWMDVSILNRYEREVPVRFKGRYIYHRGRLVVLSIIQWGMFPARLNDGDDETFWKNVEAKIVNEMDFDPAWLMNNLPLGVGVATPDGGVRYVSDVHAERLGYTADEMLGRPNLDFIHPDSAEDPEVLSKFMSVLTFGVYDWFYVKARHKNGDPVHVMVRGTLEKLYDIKCVVAAFEYLDEPPS